MGGMPMVALLISGSDPNDPNATDTWVDVKDRLIRVRNAGRGRQYEVGQSVAGTFQADMLNIDEYLNPANASSPYVDNARLMRRLRLMCQYPASPVGGATNLLWAQGIDPSFESYASGARPSWLLTVGSGVNPTVTTANPHDGTKNVTYPVTAGGGTNGIGWVVNCIPGQQYTASAWVTQSVANTTEIFINGGATGSSVTATGAYVRLSVTWTASQLTHQVWVCSFGTSLSGWVGIDSIQHEPGGSATAFATSGPKIRGVWGGHLSALPTTFDPDSQGYTGTAQLSGIGPLAALAQIGVKTDYVQMLQSKAPDYWWPLADGSNATVFAEASGHNGPPLQRLDGVNGAAPTFAPGSQMTIAGDPGATGVAINGSDLSSTTPQSSELQTGMPGTPQVSVGNSGATLTLTIAFWMVHTGSATANTCYPILISDLQYGNLFYVYWQGGATNKIATGCNTFNSSNTVYTPSVTDSWADGRPHFYVATFNIGTSTGYSNLWVDGVKVASGSSLPTSWTGPLTMGIVQLGAGFNTQTLVSSPCIPSGAYAHLAVWNRELSNADVTDLWTAAKGYVGETTGQRLTRLLGQYYVGSTVIDTGRTTLVASGATAGTKLQQIAQRVTDSEAGLLKENRDGALEFDARDSRFLATVPQAVFGENVAGGEIPYRDTPVFGYDLTQVSNDATVTQTDGTKGTAADAASQKSYYQRSITIQTDTQSGLEAIDYANWLVANRKQPKQRIERITVDPGANPSIWPQVLDLEIGQRYTVIRRAKAASGGTGITIQADYFLEWIGHRQVDFEKGTWLIDLILTPAPLQPWILGDSTYGQLGITTVLGF